MNRFRKFSRLELDVLELCVRNIWNCYDDVPYFDNDSIREKIRIELIHEIKEAIQGAEKE